MYSFLAIIKLVVLTLVTIICLGLFLHLGGLWVTDGAQGYVVLYKKPHIMNPITATTITGEDATEQAAYAAYMEQHVRSIIEVREADDFKDIVIARYVLLIIAFFCVISIYLTMRKRRKRRYFKTGRGYDIGKLKF